MIVLDAFTGNFTAHRFITIKGMPKGFHFVKTLMKKGYLKLLWVILNK
jgi:hypothetical protein